MTLSIFLGDAILHRAAPERVNTHKETAVIPATLGEDDCGSICSWPGWILDVPVNVYLHLLVYCGVHTD